MKPVELRISGWGPYKELQTIEFTRMEERGLFLITGATGAGKTTITNLINDSRLQIHEYGTGNQLTRIRLTEESTIVLTLVFLILSVTIRINSVFQTEQFPAITS